MEQNGERPGSIDPTGSAIGDDPAAARVLQTIWQLTEINEAPPSCDAVAERLGISTRVARTILEWLQGLGYVEAIDPVIRFKQGPVPRKQAVVLAAYYRMGTAFGRPPSLREIAGLLGCTQESVRQIVQRLVDTGHLERDEKGKISIRSLPSGLEPWWQAARAQVEAFARADNSLRRERERESQTRRARLLETIVRMSNELGRPPSYRELGRELGCSGANISSHVCRLERDGFLRRTKAGLRISDPETFTAVPVAKKRSTLLPRRSKPPLPPPDGGAGRGPGGGSA